MDQVPDQEPEGKVHVHTALSGSRRHELANATAGTSLHVAFLCNPETPIPSSDIGTFRLDVAAPLRDLVMPTAEGDAERAQKGLARRDWVEHGSSTLRWILHWLYFITVSLSHAKETELETYRDSNRGSVRNSQSGTAEKLYLAKEHAQTSMNQSSFDISSEEPMAYKRKRGTSTTTHVKR